MTTLILRAGKNSVENGHKKKPGSQPVMTYIVYSDIKSTDVFKPLAFVDDVLYLVRVDPPVSLFRRLVTWANDRWTRSRSVGAALGLVAK